MLRKDFHVFKTQLWPWPARTKIMKIRGFQKCKIHSCSLKGFKITACQSWCIFQARASWLLLDAGISNCYTGRLPGSSNLKCPRPAVVNLRGPEKYTNFDKPFKLQECILHFWKPLIFIIFVLAGQDHSCVLNTWKSFLNIARFRVFM